MTRREGTAIARAVLAGALALGGSQVAQADPFPYCVCGAMDYSFFCDFGCFQEFGLGCHCLQCAGDCPPSYYWCTGYCVN